jgi:hypothetical protein
LPRAAAFAVRAAGALLSTMRIGSRSAASATMALSGAAALGVPSAETESRAGFAAAVVAPPGVFAAAGAPPVTVGG